MAAPAGAPRDEDRPLIERLQRFVGSVGGPVVSTVVDGTVVSNVVAALGDENPAYTDADFAANSVHHGLVAPVTALMVWTIVAVAAPKGRHSTDPDGTRRFRLDPANSPPLPGRPAPNPSPAMQAMLEAEGYTVPAVTNGWFTYARYLRHGERITVSPTTVEEITGPKRTAIGVGFFTTASQTITDEAGEVVAVMRIRTLKARPNTHSTAGPRPETEPA